MIKLLFYPLHLLKNNQMNQEFRQIHPDFPWPSNRLMFDLYGHVHYPYYHLSGMEDAGLIAKMIIKHGINKPIKILEWGCGTGRVLCHLQDYFSTYPLDLFGTDCNRKSIAWCRTHLPGIAFSLNKRAFSYPDAFFDVIYSLVSNNRQIAWCKELKRVLKKNGLLIIGTENTKEPPLLLKGWNILDHLDTTSDKYCKQDLWIAQKL